MQRLPESTSGSQRACQGPSRLNRVCDLRVNESAVVAVRVAQEPGGSARRCATHAHDSRSALCAGPAGFRIMVVTRSASQKHAAAGAVRGSSAVPHDSEFGGPSGTLSIMIASHITLYFMWWSLESFGGQPATPATLGDLAPFLLRFAREVWTVAAPSTTGAALYLGFILSQALLAIVAPGVVVRGLPLPKTGERLEYLCNGFVSWWTTLAAVAALHITRVLPLTLLIDNIASVTSVAVIFGNAVSLLVFAAAFIQKRTERMSG